MRDELCPLEFRKILVLLAAWDVFFVSLNLNSRLQEEVGEGKIVYTDGIMPGNESKV